MKRKAKKKIAFEDFVRQIADESQTLSVASLYRLSNLAEDELHLLEIAWPSVAAHRRSAIVQHLVDLAEANFEVDCQAFFRMCLSDSEAHVRAAAIDGLWVDEDVTQIVPLLKLLRDPSALVRAAAAGSLARFVLMGELGKLPPSYRAAEADILNALRAVIADPAEENEVRRRAIEAIAYSGQDDVPGIIRDAYQSSDEKMRASAVCSMGRSADDRWAAHIIRELESPNPEMRYEAARAAGELELRKAVPRLAKLLQDPDGEVQQTAVWALGQIGGQRAHKLLRQCYASEDEVLSEAAGEALEDMALMHGTGLPLFVFDPYDDEEADLDE